MYTIKHRSFAAGVPSSCARGALSPSDFYSSGQQIRAILQYLRCRLSRRPEQLLLSYDYIKHYIIDPPVSFQFTLPSPCRIGDHPITLRANLLFLSWNSFARCHTLAERLMLFLRSVYQSAEKHWEFIRTPTGGTRRCNRPARVRSR